MKVGDLVTLVNDDRSDWLGIIVHMKQGYCDVMFASVGLTSEVPFYYLEVIDESR